MAMFTAARWIGRHWAAALLAAVACGGLLGNQHAGADDKGGPGGKGGKAPQEGRGGAAKAPFDPAARHAAAQRGLDWLEKHALGVVENEGSPRRPFLLAVTGLDVLLDAGAYAPKGARARLLAQCRSELDAWLTRVEERLADPRNLPARHGLVESSKLVQYVWPAALMGWLAAESHLRGLDTTAAKRDLVRVERVLVAAQQADGGWGHGRVQGTDAAPAILPAGMRMGGYPATLLAATNCAATALGLCDRVMARPSNPVAERARTHYERAILANGSFPYDTTQRSADRDLTGVGRTAGALVAQHALGVKPSDARVERASAFLRAHWDVAGEGHGSPMLNLLFSALASRLLGPKDVEAFEALWIPRLMATQDAEGALDCPCTKALFGSTCDGTKDGAQLPVFLQQQKAYVTALATYVLLLDRAQPRWIVPGAPARPGAVTPR